MEWLHYLDNYIMCKVSIIVPVYNVEKYLDRCMNSLLHQTLNDIEIIMVDDESPDGCPQMCDEYATKDSRIKVIHKKNGGLGFARNSGLEIAKGEYVTFLDSDDYVELDTYESLYNEAKAKLLDICYFRYRRFTDKGKRIEVSTDKNTYYFCGREQVNEFMFNMIGVDPTKTRQSNFSVSVCMGIFRLATVKEACVSFVSEREVASEDLIFHIQLLPHVVKVGVLPNVFYNYYINSSSITTSFSEAKYQRMMKLLEVVKNELLQKYQWNQIKNHYYSQQLRIIKITLRYESVAKSCFSEKIKRIRRHCSESCFYDLYHDNIINRYSCMDKTIIFFMKYRMVLPIIIFYKYFK